MSLFVEKSETHASNPNSKTIIEYAIFISLLTIISILTSYTFNILNVKLKSELSFRLNRDIICHLQKIPLIEYKKFNPTYLNQRLNVDTNKIWNFFLDYFVNIFIQMLTLISLLVLLFLINTKVFIVAVTLIPIYIISYLWAKDPLYKRGLENKEETAKYFKTFNEQLELVTEIKANSLYESSSKKLSFSFKEFLHSLMRYSKLLFFIQSLDTLISMGAKVCILLVGGFEIVNGNLSLGNFIVINSYFTMLFQCIKFYFSVGKDYQDTRNSYMRITELMDIEEDPIGKDYIENIESINLENISYKYATQDRILLNNFSFNFERGNIYLLEGDNGSGKSTLLFLILGILKGNSGGSVVYNETNIKNLDLNRIRDLNISTYIQNAKTSDESIGEILQYWTQLNPQEIIDELYERQLISLFEFEDNDISLIFNKKITLLSGGEKQKILLLCALIKAKDVLILDEPTSNLDNFSTVALCEYLKKQSECLITIIISHDIKIFNEFKNTVHLKI